MESSSSAKGKSASRWRPTGRQLQILHEARRRLGNVIPPDEEIHRLTAQLLVYGPLEPKNVYFWFVNQKQRARNPPVTSGLLTHSLNSISNIPTSLPSSTNSNLVSPFTHPHMINISTTITSIFRFPYSINSVGVINIRDVDYHVQSIYKAVYDIYWHSGIPNSQQASSSYPPIVNHSIQTNAIGEMLPLFPINSGDINHTNNSQEEATRNNNTTSTDGIIDLDLNLGFHKSE